MSQNILSDVGYILLLTASAVYVTVIFAPCLTVKGAAARLDRLHQKGRFRAWREAEFVLFFRALSWGMIGMMVILYPFCLILRFTDWIPGF